MLGKLFVAKKFHSIISHFSFRIGIAPLEAQLKEKQQQLINFDSLVAEKRSELERYQREMEQVTAELGKINEVTVQTSPVLLGVLVISLILNLLALSQLPKIFSFSFFDRR